MTLDLRAVEGRILRVCECDGMGAELLVALRETRAALKDYMLRTEDGLVVPDQEESWKRATAVLAQVKDQP